MNQPPPDWTSGPAKWAAVLVLGGMSIFGIAWSIATRSQPAAPRVTASVPRDEAPTIAAALPPPAPEDAPSPTTAVVNRLIDLNRASQAELELLPGIGPALAARIIDHRKQAGGFKSIDDLDKVKGIGPRTLEKLRPLVTVSP